jgi:1,4-alpha-glucan branching enzyme
METTALTDDILRILHNDHHDPFAVLGAHIIADAENVTSVVIRAYLPDARAAWVLASDASGQDKEYPMTRLHDKGFYEAVFRDRKEVFPYQLRKQMPDGETAVFHDSYSFMPTLSDYDMYLFNAGNHHRIYDKLGAHYAEVNGVGGVQFAVWAPGAKSVSVVGDFNGWDRRFHAMRALGSSGIWEIFIPGLAERELYKFEVKTQNGMYLDKSDPYGFEMELRPNTASVVNFLRDFTWSDHEWMEHRKRNNQLDGALSVYEVHLGSWRRGEDNEWLSYREIAHELAAYAKSLGFSHVEFLPVMEHPFDASWGYQVTGYFAPTSRFGTPQDFMYMVNHLHEQGIGVILDWVPAHFPKDIHGLGYFDGTHLYEHADPRKGEHMDWGTFIFNYGRHEVKNFLISNALFWMETYHIDGIRIDAVASMLYLDYSRREGEWIPNQYGGRENLEAIEFLKYLNSIVHQYFPGVITVAEESTAWPGVTNALEHGGLGFDLKWNMGWMHDMLVYFSKDPIYRPHHHDNLTFALLYAFTEKFLLPFSHDEVVHGKGAMLSKMPGDDWQKFANLRLLIGLMYGFPGKKLLFMGTEIGQWHEWNHDYSLDWHLLQWERHQGLQRWLKDLNTLYRRQLPLHQIDFHYSGFEWIDFEDRASSIISFERKASDGRAVLAVYNFTPVPRIGYRLGVREPGMYQELLNSDGTFYGGGNMGNAGWIHSEPVPVKGRSHSLNLTLPPLAVLFLQKE